MGFLELGLILGALVVESKGIREIDGQEVTEGFEVENNKTGRMDGELSVCN